MSTALVSPKQAAAALEKQLDAARTRLVQLLPANQSPARVIGVVQNLFARDPYLRECEPASIVRAAVECVERGLDPSPSRGEFFFIPRSVKVKGRDNVTRWIKRATGQTGYKGLLRLAYGSPRILSVDAVLVHERDRFELHRGTHPDVIHEYGIGGDRGPILGGYFAARLGPSDAAIPVWKVEDMSLADINKIRDAADSYRKWKSARESGRQWKEPPWETNYEEMCKKTLLVRGLKTCPHDSEQLTKALADEADDYRAEHAAARAAEHEPTRADDLKTKLGGTPATTNDPVDVEFEEEEIDPDGPEAP